MTSSDAGHDDKVKDNQMERDVRSGIRWRKEQKSEQWEIYEMFMK